MKLPKWLPFAALASGLVAIASGIKSGKIPSSVDGLPPLPDIDLMNEGDTVEGYTGKRWFFWYSRYNGEVKVIGPFQMTDYEAFRLESRTRSENLGVELFRFVWPGQGAWLYDTRNGPALLASRDVAPGVA